VAETSITAPKDPDSVEAKRQLFRQLTQNKGTPADVERFHELASKNRNLCRLAGDLSGQAADKLIKAITPNQLNREFIQAGLKANRKELGYDKAGAIERLLIDQVVLCRLRLDHAECLYTERIVGGLSFAQAEHWDRFLASAQRRYLRSIETLARVGKLLRSVTVQVNISQKQVNVVAGNVATGNIPAGPERSE